MTHRTPEQWDSDLAWFASLEGDNQRGDLFRELRADIAELAAAIPTTSNHGLSRDHIGIREAGTEYPKGHDAQLAPQQPGPGGRRVLPGSAT